MSQRIVEPSNPVYFGKLSKRDQFAEPFVTENCRPSEPGLFRQVVQKSRVRAASRIEEALEPFVYAGLSAKNKSPEFGLAKAQKNGRSSRAGEISAKNKSLEFAAAEAQKNGRPSRADEISAKNKSLEFGAREAEKNERPSREAEILAKNKSPEFGLEELEQKRPRPGGPGGTFPSGSI